MDVVVVDRDHGRVAASTDNRRLGTLYGNRGVWFPVPKALDIFVVLRGTAGSPRMYARLPCGQLAKRS